MDSERSLVQVVKDHLKIITCLIKGIRTFRSGAYVSFSADLIQPGKISLGEGAVIEKNGRVYANRPGAKIEIGDYTTIYPYALLKANGGTIRIGEGCSVNDYCVLDGVGGITIGDDVHIAAHVVFVASEHDYAKLGRLDFSLNMTGKGIVIENSVWIGAGAVILDGVRIGTGSVIGAGAVVTKDIPPDSIAVGVPARVIRKRI
jgi:acetyltransferase-like isoleucine patch superfamily enzyme